MQHVRLQFALILLSMVLPSILLATESADAFANQQAINSLDPANNPNDNLDHESDLLKNKSATSKVCPDKNQEQSPLLNNTGHPTVKNDEQYVEGPVKKTVAELLEKFNAKYEAQNRLNTAIQADNKATTEYELFLKQKKISVAALHDAAVEKGDSKIAKAIFQETLEGKRKKHFYDNITTRDAACAGTGFAGGSALIVMFVKRAVVIDFIQGAVCWAVGVERKSS